jgi:hypothetical protein
VSGRGNFTWRYLSRQTQGRVDLSVAANVILKEMDDQILEPVKRWFRSAVNTRELNAGPRREKGRDARPENHLDGRNAYGICHSFPVPIGFRGEFPDDDKRERCHVTRIFWNTRHSKGRCPGGRAVS